MKLEIIKFVPNIFGTVPSKQKIWFSDQLNIFASSHKSSSARSSLTSKCGSIKFTVSLMQRRLRMRAFSLILIFYNMLCWIPGWSRCPRRIPRRIMSCPIISLPTRKIPWAITASTILFLRMTIPNSNNVWFALAQSFCWFGHPTAMIDVCFYLIK